MARFLTTTDTSAAIERVIREAEGELTLISAFVMPRVIFLQRLYDAGERGVRITLAFGKRSMDGGVFKALRELPNLELFYLKELHAKCYLNEREAVVTSLNLLTSSEASNREMGVLLDVEQDERAYKDVVREARSLLRVATCIHRSTMPDKVEPQKLTGPWAARVAALPLSPVNKSVDPALQRIRAEHPRAYYKWTDEELKLLREMIDGGLKLKTIALLLQRQPSAISSRLIGT